MEPHAPLFPSFTAPPSDLYGASSYRAAEAHALTQDLDDLDREELALAHTLRALVDRAAPVPIGLRFHRTTHGAGTAGTAVAPRDSSSISSISLNNSNSAVLNASSPHPHHVLQRGGVAPVGTPGSRLGSGVQTTRGYHGTVADNEEAARDDEEEDDDDMDEDDDEDDLEELEDEEDDDADELFQDDDGDDDRAGSDSMDMSP